MKKTPRSTPDISANEELEEYSYEERLNAYIDNQGAKKLWNYFLQAFDTEYFQNEIAVIRKKWNIDALKHAKDERILWPPYLRKMPKTQRIALTNKVNSLCLKFSLHPLEWSDEVQWYLFYDKKPSSQLKDTNVRNMVLIVDVKEDKEDPFDRETQQWDDTAYPVALRISPYASQRDIVSFIQKCYKSILEPHLKSYRSKNIDITKTRKRNSKKRERNEFIYQNRDKGAYTLIKLVSEKFQEVLDHGHIGKIISLERIRRKRFV